MMPTNHTNFPGYTIRIKGSWHELLGDNLPQFDERGIAELLHLGAGWYEAVHAGFAYCIDAPGLIPTGSHRSATYANVYD